MTGRRSRSVRSAAFLVLLLAFGWSMVAPLGCTTPGGPAQKRHFLEDPPPSPDLVGKRLDWARIDRAGLRRSGVPLRITQPAGSLPSSSADARAPQ